LLSPADRRIVLDNTVVSALQQAGALANVLSYWPGCWLVPDEVAGEAAAWKAHGAAVTAALQRLSAARVVESTAVEPRSEGRLFAELTRRLGQGESAAIAIAYHRQLAVAVDDRQAQRACERLTPPVPWLSTEGVLGRAIRDGHLTRAEAEAIWRATGILDPNRSIR
jgi:predicted nucleic acid-binding protein